MHGRANIAIAMTTIFLSVAVIIFIFDRIDRLAQGCEIEPKPICKQLIGLSLQMITILLIFGGLILVIFTVIYILLSA